MDLLLALSVVAWAVGGAFCAAWIVWLDRERRELPVVLKLSTVVTWPLMFPYLLHLREDLAPARAAVNALVCALLLSAAPATSWIARSGGPRDARLSDARYATIPAVLVRNPPPGAKLIAVARPVPQGAKREAVRHWNAGIIFYQKGDYERARDEWKACVRQDPANGDCEIGLQRIEQSYGSELVSAVR